MYLAMHAYYREKSDRQLFLTRQQLVLQYQAAQDAQDKMRRADMSKKQFVSYIFHEVRVPLNTASLAVQNLDLDGVFTSLSEDDKVMHNGLISSLEMMENVLNDVLSFSRMESGQLTLVRRPFDFHQSIKLVALSHRTQAQVGGVEFSIDLDPRIDELRIIGDEMRLKQIVSNLVSNALKFTHQGSVSVVTRLVRVDEGAATDQPTDIEQGTPEKSSSAILRVQVHDTGVGLHPTDVESNKLFSPYVQTEIGRRQGGKGSGLGLALVKQLVKLCKGRLGVDSILGKGSTFWFEIRYPIYRDPGGDGRVGVQRVESGIGPATKVLSTLVVDDDGLTRKLMARIIQRLGHRVTTAEDGEVAMRLIPGGGFDIVFLDNQMPNKSGIEVVREIRALGLGIFVVGCTGNALREDREEYLSAGADEVLPKPVHRGDVVRMLGVAARRGGGTGDPSEKVEVVGAREEREWGDRGGGVERGRRVDRGQVGIADPPGARVEAAGREQRGRPKNDEHEGEKPKPKP